MKFKLQVDGKEYLDAGRAAGKGVALATVVNTWGSSPRPTGSKLVLSDDGNFIGSVSGGCVEGAVIEEGLKTIGDGQPRLLEVDTVVVCAGQEPRRELVAGLTAAGIEHTLIGGADVAVELDAKRAIWQATEFAVEY